jgi:predicted Rossmann fold flavoprotein
VETERGRSGDGAGTEWGRSREGVGTEQGGTGTDSSHLADVAIVGAGGAGLATAIFTRRHRPDASVILLDGARKPGAKILISGGSRCNVTNTVVSDRDFWGGRPTIVRCVLRAFPVDATVAFFRELGVALHEEEDGKLFPDTNRARDVLDALLREANRSGVRLLAEHRVLDVNRTADGFRLTTAGGEMRAHLVVLATGGRSLPKTGSNGAGLEMAQRLGHTIVPTAPALVPLILDGTDSFHRELSGVSHVVELAVWLDGAVATRLTGSLLWTHFGISGPVALNASRHWLRNAMQGRSVSISANVCPGRSFDEVDQEFTRLASERPKATVHSALSTLVPASFSSAMLKRLNIDSGAALAHFSRHDRRRLVHALVEWRLPIIETRGYNFAEVTSGGIALDEIDPSTMESRICPGLYLVGEMLDVDGRIGGFNFQWAWSTGFVAGRALALQTAPSG